MKEAIWLVGKSRHALHGYIQFAAIAWHLIRKAPANTRTALNDDNIERNVLLKTQKL
jgi:hypothetical protein